MTIQLSIRDLYHKIEEYKGDKILTELLLPWLEQNRYREYLHALPLNREMREEDNWELYAFSRVLDLLALSSRPGSYPEDLEEKEPFLTTDEYIQLAKSLGLNIGYPEKYAPFHCEIATAIAGPLNFEIVGYQHPVVKMKNLMIKRSPVVITLDPEAYDFNLVNSALLYWTFRRSNRKTTDLSEGWGSNSQWRTAFRLDLETGQSYIYNLNGKFDLNVPDPATREELKKQDLRLEDAIELVVNRQFIRCAKKYDYQFPYDFKYETRKNQ